MALLGPRCGRGLSLSSFVQEVGFHLSYRVLDWVDTLVTCTRKHKTLVRCLCRVSPLQRISFGVANKRVLRGPQVGSVPVPLES